MADSNTDIILSESSTTTTRVSRQVRRSSVGRPRSPSPGRARSPSRRRSLNRSPSPHRYNTRQNVGLEGEEEEEVKQQGCCIRSCVRSCCTHLCDLYTALKPLVVDLAQCALFLLIAHIAISMCGYKKCDVRIPSFPANGSGPVWGLFKESTLLQQAIHLSIAAVIFAFSLGKTVSGVPTESGTFSYLCNAPSVIIVTLGLVGTILHKDQSIIERVGLPEQYLFALAIIVVKLAFWIQWNFTSLGTIYNVVAALYISYRIEERFVLMGMPLRHFSDAGLVWAMCCTSWAIWSTLYRGTSACTTHAASRGLAILAVTWAVCYPSYPLPALDSFLNSAGLVTISYLVFVPIYLLSKHKESAKASCGMLLVLAILTGLLVQKKKLIMSFEYSSMWYCFNIGCALDALFVLARGGWETNFAGVNLLTFTKQAFAGEKDPRKGSFDLKFFVVRFGHLSVVVSSVIAAWTQYKGEQLSCPASTVLAMTLLYSATKLVCLEKAIISSGDIVDKRCSIGFMLWHVMVQPLLTLMPATYIVSFPPGSVPPVGCFYHTGLMCATFLLGLVIHSVTTLQGHFLLVGEVHSINKCLTTLSANDEYIPVSGLWKYMRYPFLTGDIIATASIALVTGFEGPLVYLPTLLVVVKSLYRVHRYNKLSPSFYGNRAWKEYQQMVKYNVVPGVW